MGRGWQVCGLLAVAWPSCLDAVADPLIAGQGAGLGQLARVRSPLFEDLARGRTLTAAGFLKGAVLPVERLGVRV